MAEVRPATLEDAIGLAPRLRQEDKDEIRANSGDDPLTALVRSLAVSDRCWSIVHDGRVVGMFGVAPVSTGVGSPWMLASPELVTIREAFLRQSRAWVEELHRDYILLTNFVDVRNAVHIRWLEWLGFEFLHLHEAHGFEGRPFLEFIRLRNV